MIISHKHRFIFIKTQKTASTSVEIALSKFCGEHDIISSVHTDEKIRKKLGYRGPQNIRVPFSKYSKLDWLEFIYTRKRTVFYDHMAASDIMRFVDVDVWNSYYKFCFERNPYDKIISWYYWTRHLHKQNTVKEFIETGMGSKIRGFNLYTIDSIPVVDKIYKYEEMEESLKHIGDVLGLDTPIELPLERAKSHTRKDRRRYTEVLSESEAEWVSKIFAREIRYLNYDY
ncbi:sulfotransferase family 2 domain-containing protein [Fulvivirga sp. 29W222]|uniref:Sulfotransferase family 2 domain-containing protein n=1 Tax=Fulvivirga marina TaxID=2494733 RepID=A0A937G2A6_9BACT|nr:sulfotransferase family 2 domain-containing protein [Fulvivirga marina]MBL6449337.1 sulfotransferase family 2 domain-containing protein [Fulvivirga marina]